MEPSNFKLLVHYHNPVHVDESGVIRLTAGTARWISEISTYFKEVGLLFPQSVALKPQQDTPILQKNVRLFSLGQPGHYSNYMQRVQHIRNMCQYASSEVDGLLVRGFTPRQYTVWENTQSLQKAFLLVSDPKPQKITNLHGGEIISVLLHNQRVNQFRKILQDHPVLMTNSPAYLDTLSKTNNDSSFVPTSTLRQSDISPFNIHAISKPCKVLYCGRLHYPKGLRELFQALSILKHQGISCNLDLASPLEEPVHSQLNEMARQLDIRDAITWKGFIPFGPDLFNLYQAADMFVLPSYTEGFPRVVWEAGANCCPVITTFVGGIPAVLQNEIHALLIPPRNPEAIADAIKHLIFDNELRTKLITNLFGLVQGYTIEASVKAMVDVLSKSWK